MTRLPNPGSDDGQWGNILNEFLSIEHNSDGTLKNVARPADIAAGVTDNSVSTSKLQDGAVTDVKIANVSSSKVTGLGTAAAQNVAASGNATSSQVVKGDDTRLTDARTPLAHASSHSSGAADALSGNLDATARLSIARAGTVAGSRRKLNFVEGNGVTISAADDSANEKIDVTIASTSTAVLPAPTGNNTGDAALINSFLNALTPGTRVTSLPGRTYMIDAPIILPSNLRFDFAHYYPNSGANPPGPTAAGTVFRQAPGANLDYMMASAAYAAGGSGAMDKPLWISGLHLDGNKANQTSGAGHGLIVSAFRSTLERIIVVSARGHGITMSDRGADGTQLTGLGLENRIEQCTVDSCGGYGIYITRGGNLNTDGWIVDCVLAFTGLEGIHLDSPAGWTIYGCHLWGTTLSAITTLGSYSTRIFDNYIEGFGGLPGVGSPVTNYAAGSTYSRYQIVVSSGLYYSLVDNNIGNTPGSSPNQWSVITSSINVYGIACFTMGYPRPTHVHDNQISLGHVTQTLSSNLAYRGILMQSPTSNTAYGICHDNVVQNELQPAGTNTTGFRYGVQGTGVLDVTSHHNRVLGNWNAPTLIDGTVVQNGTTY